jgi:release factor glutamine methyltransferase
VRILEVINKTTSFFEKRGIESPRLTIELLLAHLLKKKRLDLYMEFECELDDPTLEKLREMVKRRAAGEPLQYVTGEAEFCSLKFLVDKRVLIPRPETEFLVEAVVEKLKSGVRSQESEIKIVDVGTGSGCIAVTLAKKLSTTPEDRVTVYATDASAAALEVARANAKLHKVEKNIRFFEGDLLDAVPDSLLVDAIVSNPPYVADGEVVKLPKEVKDFEPVQALAAGEDGLKVIRRLVMTAKRSLSPSGFVALEIGAGQRTAVEELFVKNDFEVAEVVRDFQGHDRVIVAVPKSV